MIATLAYEKFPLETGGVLLGQPLGGDSGGPIIEQVVGPGENASHERTGFEPDYEWQAAEVSRRWEESPSGLSYLGDWHTHPNGQPRPSRQDLLAAQRIAEAPEALQSEPLMLIVGVDRSGALLPAITRLVDGRLRRLDLWRVD